MRLDRISHTVGEAAVAEAVVARVLTQERGIHAGDEDAGAQAVRKTGAISFAVTLRTLAISLGLLRAWFMPASAATKTNV